MQLEILRVRIGDAQSPRSVRRVADDGFEWTELQSWIGVRTQGPEQCKTVASGFKRRIEDQILRLDASGSAKDGKEKKTKKFHESNLVRK